MQLSCNPATHAIPTSNGRRLDFFRHTYICTADPHSIASIASHPHTPRSSVPSFEFETDENVFSQISAFRLPASRVLVNEKSLGYQWS